MQEHDILKILREKGAIYTGDHFVYTSGKHGSIYVNKDSIYTSTEKTKLLCKEIAKHFSGQEIERVAGPAIGGVILAQWVTYLLNEINKIIVDSKYSEILAVYAEDGPDETKIFKRGYDKLIPGKKVLIVEDIITTGGSVRKLINSIKDLGGQVIGVACLCNRGGIEAENLKIPELFSLVNLPLDSFLEDECPLCKIGVPINTELGKGREYLDKKNKK
jgi:orotate phosphoribosyltransferase